MKNKTLSLVFFMSVARSLDDMKKNFGYSGGDNILVNLLKRWQDSIGITIFTWDGGRVFLEDFFNINKVKYNEVIKLKKSWGYPLVVLLRALKAVKWALTSKPLSTDFVYSPSDFFPDSIPAFILKLRNPKVTWIASLYLFFPNPFSSNTPYKGKLWISGFLQYLLQLPIKYIIKWFADIVFVTSEPDVSFFITKKRKREDIVVVRGGVNLEEHEKIGKRPIRFDAVFMGRFHPQKGLLELIKIWHLVVKESKTSKLAIIGQGEATPEERELKKEMLSLIKQYDLSNNIELLGFLTGVEKIKVFKASRVVLHPAIYDSGGMAACEAMVCGLPGVSFDLEALKTYYSKGMLKTHCFNIQEFANNILRLLKDNSLYLKTSNDALELVKEQWNWDKRARDIYNCIVKTK